MENVERTLHSTNLPATIPFLFTADHRNDDGTITANGVAWLRDAYDPKPLPGWLDYPWTCGACLESFNDAADVRSHFLTAHPSDLTHAMLACRDCPKTFARYRAFVQHVRLRHEPLLQLCCDLCSLWFWDATLMRQHRAAHRREKRSSTSSATTQSSSSFDDPLTDGTDLHCHKCDRTFEDGASLAGHSCSVQQMCDFCPATFASREELMFHRCHEPESIGVRDDKQSIETMDPTSIAVNADTSEAEECRLYKCELCCKT